MDHPKFEVHKPGNALPFIFHEEIVHNNKVFGPNFHMNVELLLFLDGNGFVLSGEERYPAKRGDLFVINADLAHDVITADGGEIAYRCLIVDSGFCKENCIDTDHILFETKIADTYANELFEAVADAYTDPALYRVARIRTSVLRLLLYLAEQYSRPDVPLQRLTRDENIRLAISYIRAHFGEKLTLDMLADEAGLSKYHFVRTFKKRTGFTPTDFINIIRCENAQKMLLHTSCSIAEVCASCGFSSTSYFTKRFKAQTGMCPTAFISEKRQHTDGMTSMPDKGAQNTL